MNATERQLAANLSDVQARIAGACARGGRDPDSVQLIAITKYAEWSWVEALMELGITQLGESRPQQLMERYDLLREKPEIEWHLIGHLQRNKVRPMLPRVARIHSVDSLKLLQRIGLLAEELALTPKVLLEVNLVGDESKDGFSIEELKTQWDELRTVPRVQITGLMAMAPHTENETALRGTFRNLRELREELKSRTEGQLQLPELSMGMSGDYEIAIEEGATHIRIGSRLFEGLEPS
ncbi:MAG: YggS family pyridoxal phosphate-dependent enzyme [Planctomycetaceae bacterium]|nr:YggS family pyridoxal phosphate-dependent enzyme [Planctomycetaceae bacterium]